MNKVLFAIVFSIMTMLVLGTTSFAQNYYVSNSGNDNNSGTSPENPWKSVSKVNNFNFIAGDIISFKSGDTWTEQLLPKSGNKSGNVTYQSYGIGEKPALLGSISKNNESDWLNSGNNIWTLNITDNPVVSEQNIPLESIQVWGSDKTDGDKSIKEEQGQKALEITCIESGTIKNDIQIILNKINTERGKSYIFSFKAKSTSAFELPEVPLMKSDSPWTEYFSFTKTSSTLISNEWNTYNILYIANTTDDNARITLYVGGVLPDGSKLYFSSLSMKEISDGKIYSDVGNIILNDGKAIGIKVFNESDLNSQNKFYYDEANKTIKIYSLKNPASLYNSIECALGNDIVNIDNKSYVNLEGLSLKYGGAHGIGGTNTSNITIKNCDISYIGGSKQYVRDGQPVRYGNGIEFWNNAHDNLVTGCKIFEIYDAAVTNQGNGDGNKQYNITYSNNAIWNSEYSFEYWNHNSTGVTNNIQFTNNICSDAGFGWGHSQRPDKSGMHISFCNNTAATSNVSITNNVFANSTNCTLYVAEEWNGIETLNINNNEYVQSENNNFAAWRSSGTYSAREFTNYQKTSGVDNASVISYLKKEPGKYYEVSLSSLPNKI